MATPQAQPPQVSTHTHRSHSAPPAISHQPSATPRAPLRLQRTGVRTHRDAPCAWRITGRSNATSRAWGLLMVSCREGDYYYPSAAQAPTPPRVPW